MNFLRKLFKKKNPENEMDQILENLFGKDDEDINLIVVFLNDKIMPIERGEIYEDPLDKFLKENNIGEVLGAGTTQSPSGELDWCNIDIQIYSEKIEKSNVQLIIDKLIEFGAPKGSRIVIDKTDERIYFGEKEGLGIYLDGTNLDKEVYEKCDSNIVLDEIKKLTKDDSKAIRYWQGQNETALYFYSDSYDKMKDSIKEFVAEYPLCENARIEQIA